eukprot:Skav225873  [mRNA]  locus=scaffold810:500523:502126:+ [translate_table: standard]
MFSNELQHSGLPLAFRNLGSTSADACAFTGVFTMAVSGTVTSYNPHKGWGFIECNGQDVFVNRRQCGGYCLAKGMKVAFNVTQGEKAGQDARH